MSTHSLFLALGTCGPAFFAATVGASHCLYEYASPAGSDPSLQGWTLVGAGELPTLVSCDGSLTTTGAGWRLCDSTTSGALALVYDWNGNIVSGDKWSLTMEFRWERDKIDATGNVSTGGANYFVATSDRQSFVWRVGDGNAGFYEIRFGKGSGSTITASSVSSSSAPVTFGFEQDVSLTLTVSHGEASLLLEDQVVLEHLELTLSEERSRQILFGDPTGNAQGNVTVNSIWLVPEPTTASLALTGAVMLLVRRRRRR